MTRTREQNAKYARTWRKKNPERAQHHNFKNYITHREQRSAASREWYKFHKSKVAKLKATPCLDCGLEWPPYVMEFHHVRGKKYSSVSRLLGRRCWQVIADEIAKCDLLCANCHRVRTYYDREVMGKSGRPRVHKAPGAAEEGEYAED